MDDIKVKSLGKALEILNEFTNSPCEYGVSELAKKMDITKSTVHNILSTFAHYNILEYDERSHKYRIGNKVLELSNVFQRKDAFVSIMHPFLQQISDRTNECVYLGKPSGNDVLYLDAIFPETATGRNVIGVKAPMYCTGIGKAMLSRKDDIFISQIPEASLKPYTDYTIINRTELFNNITEIRNKGYAIDNMEHEFGIKCVAVPILDSNNSLVGGISISGPSLRFPDNIIDEYASILTEVASTVKKYL